MPNTFQVVSTFDKSQVNDGIDGMKAGFKTLAENVNLSTQEAASSFRKNWLSIGDVSKALAGSMSADQIRMAESTIETTRLTKEQAAALKAALNPTAEAQQAASVLAATQVRLAEAYALSAANIKAQRDAAARGLAVNSANDVVGGAASSGAADSASRQVAAATLEETAAKNQLRDVTDALGNSTLSQAEKELALANVQTLVRNAVANRIAAETELQVAARASAEALALQQQQVESTAAAQQAAAAAMRVAWDQEIQAQDRVIEKNTELARSRELSTLRADIETRSAQSAAWEQEMLTQDRMIEKNAELTRSREMAALKADILARSELSSWQQEVIAQDRVIEKNAELARSQELAALKANILSRAEDALGAAGHGAVTGQQAASAAIRSFEGNAGLRAIENFIAKTLGLGPVLQAVFPVIGAVAFGEMLLTMGTKVVELEQKGKHAAEELARGFGEMNEKLHASNDELALNNSKLEDQLAKLSGHPSNGLETALLEAKVAADKLQESLAGDLKSLNDLLKQHDVGFFEGVLANVGPTGGQTKEIAEYNKGVERQGREARAARVKAYTEAGQDHDKQEAADQAYYARMDQIAANAATHMRTRATQIAEEQARITAVNTAVTGTPGGGEDLSARRGEFEAAAETYDDIQGRAKLSGSTYATQKKIGQAKQDKANDAGTDDDAAKAQLKDIEAHFAELNQATANIKGHGLTAEDALAFWAPYLTVFAARSDEAKKILEEVAKAQDGVHKQIVEGTKKIKEEQSRTEAEGDRAVPKGQEAATKMLKEQSDDALRAGAKWDAYWASIAKGQEQAARTAEEIALTRVKLDEENGSLSHTGAAHQVAALHAKEHEDALRALRLELEKLNAEARRDPLTGAVSDPKQAKQIQDVQNQIAAEQGKGQQQKGQDQKAVADAMAKPYLAAFGQIESGWMTAQNEMLRGNKNLAQSMKAMWSGIALDALQNIEKIGFGWARHEITMIAQHQASAATNAATDSTAASTSVATDALAALKKMNHSAAVAAGKAWGAFADIPIVGPELGAVAAAATYSGVMALAAFEQGTMYVPRAGAAVLHPGEAVLGSPSAQVMRDAMSGKLAGAGGGGDVHLHMGGNTINGNAGDFPAMLAKHEGALTSAIVSLHRRGKLKGVTG